MFSRAKVAVFVDGCFWHGCPEHHSVAKTNAGFWASKVAGNRDRDEDTNERLTEAGWTVVRVWEHLNAGEAAAEIAAIVRGGLRSPSDGSEGVRVIQAKTLSSTPLMSDP